MHRISDEMLAKNLANNPHWAYLDGYLPDASKKRVDLQTLEIQDRPAFQPDIVEYIRSKRANLLSSSDWTQMPDSPLSDSKKQEWAVYRQALRDMPDTTTATTVDEIVWPVRP